jgi:hypothetical protein
MFPLAGIAQVTVGENHAVGIETEIAINVVLLRKVNPMNGIRISLRTATFPEKEDPFGLSPDSEKGIRGKCRKCGSMLRRIMEAVVAHFEHVAGVLLLVLLVLVQRGAGCYEFPGTGGSRSVGHDIEIIDCNAVCTYPSEYMMDSPDVKRRLAARDVEMVDMPDMPQQVAYMFQRDIHGFGISPHAVGTAHVATSGNLDAEILDI